MWIMKIRRQDNLPFYMNITEQSKLNKGVCLTKE